MAVRLKIADTYKRKVKVQFPGTGLKPEEHEIVVVFRDVDPDKLQSDQEKIAGALNTLMGLIHQLRDGDPDKDSLEKAEEQVNAAEDITPKIDQVVAGIELPEGMEVIGADDEPVTGKALVEFAKKYPRWKMPILKAYEAENETGEESAALGNLLRSGGRGRA